MSRNVWVGKTETVLVDDEDYMRVACKKWSVCNGQTITMTKLPHTNLANFIFKTENIMYDHKNRNPFDFRKENLRPATQMQNAQNSKKRSGTTSKYKGVSWNRGRRNCWQAQIKTANGNKHLGYFKDEIEAAKAYNRAALKYFGEFSNLNVLES